MPKFNMGYSVVAGCGRHGFEHKETLARRMEAADLEEALSGFWKGWDTDDYGYFKNLEFCPACQAITNTSCTIDAIEIFRAEDRGDAHRGATPPAGTSARNAQTRALCAALHTEYHDQLSAYAVCCAIRDKASGGSFLFREEEGEDFVAAVRRLFNDDMQEARAALERYVGVANNTIVFADDSGQRMVKSVPTYMKNIQNKSLCEALQVPYHKIHAAKAVVMLLKEHGLEPRAFRADNTLDFAGAVLALFDGNARLARKSLEAAMKKAGTP